MRIYSMTATFGKLERQTLTLEPGLNIIHAPNEWGKSTWCAFLLAMLYGIDTRERGKQGTLADKERYAPWSGAPMEGSIQLRWRGRNITIERSSTARIPLGNFRAYETDTGLEVPELTAANCGQQLLGVERNVFVRAGFLRLWDMPVTQDDALRRRLNDLVTTGDESGAADKLGQSLKDLRNRCRSNRANGLLPEAEAQRDRLREQLWDVDALQARMEQLRTQITKLESEKGVLEQHRAMLTYEAARQDLQRLEQAKAQAAQLAQQAKRLEAQLEGLPSRQEAEADKQAAQRLLDAQAALQARKEALPPEPAAAADLDPVALVEAARADDAACIALNRKKEARQKAFLVYGVVGALALLGLLVAKFVFSAPLPYGLLGLALALAGMGLLLWGYLAEKKHRKLQDVLYAKHPGQPSELWVANAMQQAYRQQQLAAEHAQWRSAQASWDRDQAALLAEQEAFGDPKQRLEACGRALQLHDQLTQAQREQAQAQQLAEALEAVVEPMTKPEGTDLLTFSAEETQQRFAAAERALDNAREDLAEARGKLDALGQAGLLREQLESVNRRIARLETYNAALEMAQDALHQASLTLQQKFAPRITRRAQELFSRMTGGRYDRLTLDADFSVQTAARDEVTLHRALFRSEGTVDQLYLALRLAVAEALTPEAPLVLDDALARFDDDRQAAAMEILGEMAKEKQVILFTCRQRETI